MTHPHTQKVQLISRNRFQVQISTGGGDAFEGKKISVQKILYNAIYDTKGSISVKLNVFSAKQMQVYQADVCMCFESLHSPEMEKVMSWSAVISFRNVSPMPGVLRGRNAPVPSSKQHQPEQRTYSSINTKISINRHTCTHKHILYSCSPKVHSCKCKYQHTQSY